MKQKRKRESRQQTEQQRYQKAGKRRKKKCAEESMQPENQPSQQSRRAHRTGRYSSAIVTVSHSNIPPQKTDKKPIGQEQLFQKKENPTRRPSKAFKPDFHK
jgi:hypothetical protein